MQSQEEGLLRSISIAGSGWRPSLILAWRTEAAARTAGYGNSVPLAPEAAARSREPGCHRVRLERPMRGPTRVFEAQKASTSREDIDQLSRSRGILRAPESPVAGVRRGAGSIDRCRQLTNNMNAPPAWASRRVFDPSRIFLSDTSPPSSVPHGTRRVEGPRARRGAMEGEGDTASPLRRPSGAPPLGRPAGRKRRTRRCARAFPPGRC